MAQYITSSESGHWYFPDGRPAYEMDKKDGSGKTPTTLAHARKLGLLPSVTTITSIKSKKALNNWLKEQAILAALTTARKEHEADVDFVRRINEESERQGKEAAEEGARIHGVIEKYFDTGDSPADEDKVGQAAVGGVLRVLEEFGLVADSCELPFGNITEGYAGCVDLHAHHKETGRPAILDFKTKDGLDRFKDKLGRPVVPSYYFDYAIQLAAYIKGSGKDGAMAITVPICRKTGDCLGIAWTEDDMTRGLGMFQLEKELFFLENKFDPRKAA